MSGAEDLMDFGRARRKASFGRLAAFMTRKRDRLESLAEAVRHTWSGCEIYVRSIEVGRIIGSESRAREFNRGFLPSRNFLVHRWSKVNEAYRLDLGFPAIKVFELDGMYYVRDGNHRVSVARFHGVEFIDAEVTRITAA